MLLRRLLFIGLFAAWLGSSAALAAGAAPTPRRNVLLIVADDLNCDLGSYGNRAIKTPHLDRLAARGVQFDRAYCQFPLCAPSRASFLTGRRPAVTGVLGNPDVRRPVSPHFREKLPATITLPQHFKQNGWFAVRIGKLYHYGVPREIGTGGHDDPWSWDLTINPRGRDRDEQEKITSITPGQYAFTLSWHAAAGEDEEQTDGLAASEAIRLLERFAREDRPFFLSVGFFRPHTPYVAPQRYFDLYPLEQIALPVLSADDRARRPGIAYESAFADQDRATDEQRRRAIQGYRASTSFMDAQAGRVLTALDRLGLTANTIVVFLSDHGYHLGDHGLWQKLSLYERSLRVPLIIAAPGLGRAGVRAAGLVELLDLYPTLADLAGLPGLPYLEGRSLRPMLENPAVELRTAAFSEVNREGSRRGYSVRSGPWRYIEWLDSAGAVLARQLFDEERDPAEAQDLAADPRWAAQVTELSALLATRRP